MISERNASWLSPGPGTFLCAAFCSGMRHVEVPCVNICIRWLLSRTGCVETHPTVCFVGCVSTHPQKGRITADGSRNIKQQPGFSGMRGALKRTRRMEETRLLDHSNQTMAWCFNVMSGALNPPYGWLGGLSSRFSDFRFCLAGGSAMIVLLSAGQPSETSPPPQE